MFRHLTFYFRQFCFGKCSFRCKAALCADYSTLFPSELIVFIVIYCCYHWLQKKHNRCRYCLCLLRFGPACGECICVQFLLFLSWWMVMCCYIRATPCVLQYGTCGGLFRGFRGYFYSICHYVLSSVKTLADCHKKCRSCAFSAKLIIKHHWPNKTKYRDKGTGCLNKL